jgi:two-component system, response regulator PdtaR
VTSMSEDEHDAGRTRCILVVENELFIALDIKSALITAGLRVLGPAASVEHALDLLRDTRPDAAVLDVDLIGERVIPVALQLRALGVPFVLATALDAAEIARYPVLAEASNLGKPTDVKRLADVVRQIAA